MRWLLQRIGVVALVAACLSAVGICPARASNLWYSFGPVFTQDTSDCWLFTPYTPDPSYAGASCGSKQLSLTGFSGSPQGTVAGYTIQAPAGINLDQVRSLSSGGLTFSGSGWNAGMHWGNPEGYTGNAAFNTSDHGFYTGQMVSAVSWGFWLSCGSSSCADGSVNVPGVYVDATETGAPAVSPANAGLNLWTTGQSGWVWNAPGDPWPIVIAGSDPTGICNAGVQLGNEPSVRMPAPTPNPHQWQECPQLGWVPTVDTNSVVNGPQQLTISAANAAGLATTLTPTIHIDNQEPGVGISAFNDPDPAHWAVNHAVTLQIRPVTGPSGVSALSCQDEHAGLNLTPDSSNPGAYTATVDGNGHHGIVCRIANNAVNPHGYVNTGVEKLMVDIDEQPPSLTFEPTDPANPAQVVVDTSDSESPVASGQLQIAPTGSNNWTPIPTTFAANGQLIGTIPDATLAKGSYVLQATATSQVGNSGTATKTITLPLRGHAHSYASFAKVADPLVAKRVKERVRVGWHWGAKLNKKGQPVKVKVGGHFVTKRVIKWVKQCKRTRVKTGKHRWRVESRCVKPHIVSKAVAHVAFGHKVTLHGLLISAQGVPIANQTVKVLAAADNGLHRFHQVLTAATDGSGIWTAKLPAGPSRIVKAYYPGDATILPATGEARVRVPAKIDIRISPRHVSWKGWITIRGHLVGGWVPKDGVALRLLVRYPGSRAGSPLLALRTNRKGSFRIRWTFNAGRGHLRLPFWVATDSNESDYPFTAGASRRVAVRFHP